MASDRLPLVQVLRAIAALLVTVQHVQNDAATLAARQGASFAPSQLLPWNAGVDVFFVISGFVIVHAARPLFGRPGAAWRFLAHRAARVAPLYWLMTTLYLAVALALPGLLGNGGERPTPGLVVASYLFLPWARPDGSVVPLYSLGWTLNYEALFYVLFAASLALPRRAAVAAVLTVLTGLALAGAASGGWPLPLRYWADPIVLEFAFGALIGLGRAEGLRLPSFVCAALAAAGLALLALAGEAGPRVVDWGGPAALLVAGAVLGPTRDEGGTRAVWLRTAVVLGDASYALYLVHPFASRATRELAWHLGLGSPAFVALALVGAVAASLAVHRLIERPLTRRARALLQPLDRSVSTADRPPPRSVA